MLIEIPLPTHFSYDECLWYLDRGMDECLYSIENDKIVKSVYLDGHQVPLEISYRGSVLTVEALSNGENLKESSIVSYVRSWFDLDRELKDFYALAGADPLLRPLINRYHGLRLMGINDLFEALSWSIIGQQINLRFAYKLKRALVEKFGTRYDHNGHTLHFFPTPEVLINATKEDLLALQFSKQKASYMLHLSQAFVGNQISKDELQQLSLAEAIKRLSAIHGIGPWTANYVAMRCLKFMDAFPMGDAGLQNAIKYQWQQKEKPTMDQLAELSKKWAGWQAYATLFLWRSLSDKP